MSFSAICLWFFLIFGKKSHDFPVRCVHFWLAPLSTFYLIKPATLRVCHSVSLVFWFWCYYHSVVWHDSKRASWLVSGSNLSAWIKLIVSSFHADSEPIYTCQAVRYKEVSILNYYHLPPSSNHHPVCSVCWSIHAAHSVTLASFHQTCLFIQCVSPCSTFWHPYSTPNSRKPHIYVDTNARTHATNSLKILGGGGGGKNFLQKIDGV